MSGAVVRSTNSVFFFLFLVNLPITSNWTGLVVTDVLMAVGRGVNSGVAVFVGVGRGVFFAGVCVAVGVGVRVAVGDGGGPSEMVRS